MNKHINLLRIDRVKERIGHCANSTVYLHVNDNLITKPVKIGPRASAWPEHEIDKIVAARISGKTDDEVRKLVKELTANREFALTDILAA
jgi:prophage regulatory protein